MDKYISIGDRQKGTELARRYEAQAGRPIQQADTTAPTARTEPPVKTAGLPPSKGEPTVIEARQTRRPPPPTSKPEVAAVQPATTGAWRAQLGAFRDPDGARRLWGQVAPRFPGRQPYYVKAGALTRLLVGPFASQADAARGCGSVKPCVPTR